MFLNLINLRHLTKNRKLMMLIIRGKGGNVAFLPSVGLQLLSKDNLTLKRTFLYSTTENPHIAVRVILWELASLSMALLNHFNSQHTLTLFQF
jgi:hypothetical protein